MDKDNDTEKLIILPEKIIQILLKEIMVLKNENAYITNKAGMQLFEMGLGDDKDDSYLPTKGTSAKDGGSNLLLKTMEEKLDGDLLLSKPILQEDDGSKLLPKAIPEKEDGSKLQLEAIGSKPVGSQLQSEAILPKEEGSYLSDKGIPPEGDGSKLLPKAIPGEKDAPNDGVWLYKVFKDGLMEALEQSTKNKEGQIALYNYYINFKAAVAEKNEDAVKKREAALNIPLEETHSLPKEIPINEITINHLADDLSYYFPKNALWDMKKKVAIELLVLHNVGVGTGLQLRVHSGLSEGGFAKHLPRLQERGLIKKQPPKSYVLTDLSKHILLKTFGVPK